jgi:hypothetical protein
MARDGCDDYRNVTGMAKIAAMRIAFLMLMR